MLDRYSTIRSPAVCVLMVDKLSSAPIKNDAWNKVYTLLRRILPGPDLVEPTRLYHHIVYSACS